MSSRRCYRCSAGGESGQQVADVLLVTGRIDEREFMFAVAVGREPQVDGDATTFFFGMGVGIDAGQRTDNRSLAVVDVTDNADDRVAHQ